MGTKFNPGWEAGLELRMSRRDAVTRLTHARHWGPLRVQRPFYPGEDGECHLYLLHPPGGMVTGDVIEMDIQLDRRARALLTTPSAGKVYRGNATADSQRQQVAVNLADESFLEWMPLETIAFDGARGELSLKIRLENKAHCALWDIVCLGRPASDESFTRGYFNQRLQVWRGDRPLYVEGNRFGGGSDMLVEPWGNAGYSVSGTFLATGEWSPGVISDAREMLGSPDPALEMVALSQLEELIAIRYLGNSAENCRRHFLAVWRYLKPLAHGRKFLEPRIWST